MNGLEETKEPISRDTGMTSSRDWTDISRRREAAEALDQDIQAMSEEQGSGVRMCHEQGKTAVYLSGDGRFVVEHEPSGAIRHLPLETLAQPST